MGKFGCVSAWVYGCMELFCVYGFVGVGVPVHACVGAWVYACVGVGGSMGVWASRCMGV